MIRGTGRLLITASLVAVLAASGSAGESGEIRGRIRLQVPDTALSDLGAAAVYLDAPGRTLKFPTPERTTQIVQKNASFDPKFLVVAAGQTVEMPNADVFYHNVFSYSRPNDFDLGLYPMGESRSVELRHAGVVHVYCSIHESMRAVIVVAPSPWFAVVSAQGEFLISGVPAGKYQLHTFSELLPSVTRQVTVVSGKRTRLDIAIEPEG